jgi:hypothetical protein
MKSITIATPMYGGVCHGAYLKSILSLTNLLGQKGYRVNYTDLSNESLITRARNTLTELFLRTGNDYLLFIDSDQGFNADGVVKMIEENVDIIGAAVPMKGINWESVKKAVLQNKEDLSNHTAIYNVNISEAQKEEYKKNPNSIVEVDYIGTGLMLISRNVFQSLKEHTPSYRSDQHSSSGIQYGETIYDFWRTEVDPESNRLLSEDYNFCKMWRSIGGKIYLAPYAKVVHVGTYWFK